MEKFNVSVILPIKSGSAFDFDEYFVKAITSLKEQKTQINELVIVHTDETKLLEVLDTYDFGDLNIKQVKWDYEPNFCEQVNLGIQESSSEWISIFEFDDEYSKIWFDNVEKYSSVYNDVDVFLPIVVDTDEKGKFVGFTNEATFALNISSEIGLLTNEVLQQYQNFQISGMVIKKSALESTGLFKGTIKLTFGYEFLLRASHYGLKIMSLPKIGYKHTNFRPGSIFWNYKNGDSQLQPDEVKFWIESAKKEYFFTSDRKIKYEGQIS
jgi:hypothetical protein